MGKRRVRLTDENDPLNSTERVLAGFEQVSKMTSQEVNKSTSQQDKKSGSQENNQLTSQQDKKPTRQKDNTLASQLPNKTKSQQDKKSTRQKVNKITSPIASLPTSQPVNKLKLRKSTFQISEEVLNSLDQLHLGLQLELGKKDAPYKEVIVEEAIVQLLKQINSNRAELLEVLAKRQTERGN